MSEVLLLEAYRRFHANSRPSSSLWHRASAPLLLKPQQEWFSSPRRLLIIGQETNGWTSTDKMVSSLEHFHKCKDGVEMMQAAYSDFDFASTYSHRNSAFWRAFRLLKGNHSVLWTNLFRTDVDGSVVQNCRVNEWKLLLQSQGMLLREEIHALAPTAVLFLTGPRYDAALQEVFSDAALEALWSDVPEREAARVMSALLPRETVRIYHPSFLQRSRRWRLVERLAQWLDCDAYDTTV